MSDALDVGARGAVPDGPDALRAALDNAAKALPFVALIAHGVEWEIAPSIVANALRDEPLILEAFLRLRAALSHRGSE